MILLDSNVVIYATQAEPEYDRLRGYLLATPHCVSLVSYVEVLGFHKITEIDKAKLEIFFEATSVLSISAEIATRAVGLRQKRRMSLGDALIAATALEEDLELATNNTKDFKWINELTLIDPFADTAPSQD